MPEVRASITVGDYQIAIAARRRGRHAPIPGYGHRQGLWSLTGRTLPIGWTDAEAGVPTVRDFVVSPARRLADAVAGAAVVRDVAALGALVLFGTMLAVILSSTDFLA